MLLATSPVSRTPLGIAISTIREQNMAMRAISSHQFTESLQVESPRDSIREKKYDLCFHSKDDNSGFTIKFIYWLTIHAEHFAKRSFHLTHRE